MFVVLDTNYFTEVIRESGAGARLARRLIENDAEVFVSIITAQESFDGWLAVIKSHPPGSAQVKGYSQFRPTVTSRSSSAAGVSRTARFPDSQPL